MRSRSLVLAALMLLASAGAATAGNTFSYQGGASVPFGYFSDDAGTGHELGVAYTHWFNGRAGLGIGVQHGGWGATPELDSAAEQLFGAGSHFSFGTWEYNLHGILLAPVNGPVQPFVQAGLGLYNANVSLATPSGKAGTGESHWGYDAGGGLQFAPSSRYTVAVYAMFHEYKSEPLRTSWATLGLRVSLPMPGWELTVP